MEDPRVLIIDDCRMTTLLLRHILRNVGLDVDTASDGPEGLELAKTRDYPLIFLDVMLPTLNGFDICRAIREAELSVQPRIIIVTALGETCPVGKHAEVGADDIFFKPLVPSRIEQVAREACAEREPD
jgi:DNA-binding response OmpR family regulator